MLLIMSLTPPAALPLRKTAATRFTGGWVVLVQVRMAFENRKYILLPSFEPRSLQLLASLCTDSAAM